MAKIQLKKESIVVRAENKTEVLRCLAIPRYTKLFDDTYEYPHIVIMGVLQEFFNISNLVELSTAIANKKLPDIMYKIAEKYSVQNSHIERLKMLGPHSIESDSTLFKHQELGRQIALLDNRYCFFYDTGTGKTLMALQIILDDLLLNPGNKWLVVCPLALINTAWIHDCNRFFPYVKIVSLHGNTPAQTRKAYSTPGHVFVINFESAKINLDVLMAAGFAGVIIDESSKLKNPTSGISKAMDKLSKVVKKWYNLSGTPAPNSMLEYYMQLKLVDVDNRVVPKNFTSFKAKWFFSYSKGGFDAYDILPEKKEELIEVIKQKAIFIAKKDCLDLPPVVDEVYEIDMPKELAVLYKSMREDLYSTIVQDESFKQVFAASNVVALGKLNQLTSGIIIDENQVIHNVSPVKLNALLETLDIIGNNQVIIWANFKGEFNMIKEKLQDTCVTYYGETDKTDIFNLCEKHYGKGSYDRLRNGAFDKASTAKLSVKDIAVKLFKEGKVQYFVGNPASAAYGLTLTNAHYTVYFGLNYSYEQYSQSRDRTNRYGQTNSCTYIHLLMKNSIDYVLYKVLHDKADLSQSVLTHLKPESIGG